jgi:hypothetical protein
MTVMLLAWVVLLLVQTMRTPTRSMIDYWNGALCVVLLLPVSHLAYAVYALPVLWCWAGRLLQGAHIASWAIHRWRVEPLVFGVFLVMCCWWLVLNHSWPDNGSSANISSLRYSVVFATNLIACTVSVAGSRRLRENDEPSPFDGAEQAEPHLEASASHVVA